MSAAGVHRHGGGLSDAPQRVLVEVVRRDLPQRDTAIRAIRSKAGLRNRSLGDLGTKESVYSKNR